MPRAIAQRAHPRPSDTECSTQPERSGRRALALWMAQLHIVEVFKALGLWRARREPTHVIHRDARHRAEPAAGAPTTDTSEPPLLDANLAAPPEMHDHLVIATPRRHPAGGSVTIRIHTMDIECTRSRPGIMNPGRPSPLMVWLPKLGLGWQDSAHHWTGTTCWAVSLDCSEWS